MIIDADEQTGRATDIERLSYSVQEIERAETCRISSICRSKTIRTNARRSRRRADARADRASSSRRSRRTLTVTELTVRVRDLLESEFFEVWVEGELSNCRLWNTGHLYFTLKDEAAQIRGVIFRSALRYLKFKPADGLHVIARGKISVYEPKGEYQLVCEHMEPHGLGALQLAFEQLKKRLQAEGLFDRARKRPLPVAAAQDRDRHLARRRGDPRHHQGAAPPLHERAPDHPPGARAG